MLRVWNIVGYLLYAGLLAVGWYEIWFSLFFGMATDACHDSGCDASYHVWPAMVTVWIGVGVTLLLTLAVMVAQSIRGRIVVGWPFAGLLMLGIVFVIANDVVLH
ncbi:MAG TPA: hypothetical protein VFR27_08720 [Mycobacterium sp.]|nr:hypothetical protein [Mycobacterium sp.]